VCVCGWGGWVVGGRVRVRAYALSTFRLRLR
jgi:hypothetical protein